jgi:hypothetical protein
MERNICVTSLLGRVDNAMEVQILFRQMLLRWAPSMTEISKHPRGPLNGLPSLNL